MIYLTLSNLDVGELVQQESLLKAEISKLTTERDEIKKLLKDSKYYDELQHSISSLSSAILMNTNVKGVKPGHIGILKNLIDESVANQIITLEGKLMKTTNLKNKIRDLCIDQMQRSKSAYGMVTKYIEFINNLAPNNPASCKQMIWDVKTEMNKDQSKILGDIKSIERWYNALNQDESHIDLDAHEVEFNKGPLQKQLVEKDHIIKNLQNKLIEVTSPKNKLLHRKSMDSFTKYKKGKRLQTSGQSMEFSNYPVKPTQLFNDQSKVLIFLIEFIANMSIQQAENNIDFSSDYIQRINTEESLEQSKFKFNFDEPDPQPISYKKIPQKEGVVSKSSIDLSKFV